MSEQTPPNIVAGSETTLPVLPLRDVVVFPHMVIPLFVGRRKSIRALEQAMEAGKQIMLVAQKSASDDDPTTENIHTIGTVASILQLLKLPDGTVKVLVEGERRGVVQQYHETAEYFAAQVALLAVEPLTDKEGEALMRSVLAEFDQYVKLNMKIPPEILTSLSGIEDPERLADTIAAHLSLKIDDKQQILEIQNVRARLERILSVIENEIDLLQVEKRIRGRVKRQMEKSQREYYLNEQMKAIQKELGELEETPNEAEELARKIAKAGMPKDVRAKTEAELNKLKMMSPMSAEATVVRNYIDWLLNVPWKKRTKIQKDLSRAEEILEADHYGLEKVKERILEYLAVQQRVTKSKGPILCLVGPPGVGKTSLGQSIARATNRKFTRMSLGGVRDEAEIRGDPSSALLEVLDPEQNHAFNDHYLEVDYDLSDVMFIATANTLNIPAPLLDRMEVIRLSGYTEDEKVNIAIRYLIPKQLKNNGLKPDEIAVAESAIRDIVRYYTREAGVRSLEREISKVFRKVAKDLLLKKAGAGKKVAVTARALEKYLGVRRYRYGIAEKTNQVGQVTGLAWTEVGGELLTIEAVIVPGKGKLTITGKLGEVMQESIQAAMSVVRSRAARLGIPVDFYQKHDFHVHVPEGATPKDGPSAGIAMCTAMVSALTKISARADVAMTGEITLRGEVLPIGGLKEKLLAAHRGGVKNVLIPEENRKDLTEIPKNIRDRLDIRPVRWIDQVLEATLERMPEPLEEGKAAEAAPAEKTDAVGAVTTH